MINHHRLPRGFRQANFNGSSPTVLGNREELSFWENDEGSGMSPAGNERA